MKRYTQLTHAQRYQISILLEDRQSQAAFAVCQLGNTEKAQTLGARL